MPTAASQAPTGRVAMHSSTRPGGLGAGRGPLRSILAAAAVVGALSISACAAPPATGAGPAPVAPGSSITSPPSAAGFVVPGPPAPSDPPAPSSPPAPSDPASGLGPITSAHTVGTGPGSTASSGAAVGGVSTPLPQCLAENLPTHTPGILTVAAAPAERGPWVDGNPTRGQGLDPATVNAMAALLGFPASRVHWVSTDPETAVAAPSAVVDLGVGRFVIPDRPGGSIDYSTGYFGVTQVVVTRRSATVTPSLAGVRGARVAVAGESRAAAALAASPALTGGLPPSRLVDPAAALAAVRGGTADAAAVDIVTATAAPDLKILGELPAPVEKAQVPQLGLVLPQGSKLTPCVSTAIDMLRVQGSLAALKTRWIPVAPLK